jgi:hypothetical protein
MITRLLEQAFTTDKLRLISTGDRIQLWATVGRGCFVLVDTIANEAPRLGVVK